MSLGVSAVSTRNVHEGLFALLRQVEENSRHFTETGLGFAALQGSILAMEKMIFSVDGGEAAASAILDGLPPAKIAGLNKAYSLWETTLEFEFIDRLLQGNACLSDYLFYRRIEGLVRRELTMIQDVTVRRILIIGTGPLPMGAVHAHLQTGALVDCGANDEKSAMVARQVLAACGLERSIAVFAEDGSEYDLSPYDVVVVEVQRSLGPALLKRLRKRCKPGCQILSRTAHGLRRLIYPASLDRSPHGFHVKGWQIADGEQTVSTCFLEPAASAASDVILSWLSGIDSQKGLQILRLMNRTLEEETTIGFPGPIDDETGSVLMRQLDADIRAGRRHVLVAEKEGTIVGQVILTPNSTPNHHHMVELTRGTIDRSFRGAGLALRAFQEVASKCEELGREVICLDVRAGTMAAMWWQYFGFRPYGILEDYSRVGDKKYAGLFLMQTTAGLKQQVREIVRGRPATTTLANVQ